MAGKVKDNIGDAHMALAYCDHERNRMIICMEAVWPSLSAQERAFDSLPISLDKDSPWIVDFHDENGSITKDKIVTAETIERMTVTTIEELIRRGNEREDRLTAMIRSRSAGRAALSQQTGSGE